jgi:hypothetical protein
MNLENQRRTASELKRRVRILAAAPEGANDYAVLAVCLKAYPDANLAYESRLFSQPVKAYPGTNCYLFRSF